MENDFVDVRAPLFENSELKKEFEKFEKIWFSGFLLNNLCLVEDNKNSVQMMIQIIMNDLKLKNESGEEVYFTSTMINEKKGFSLDLKAENKNNQLTITVNGVDNES